MQAPFQFLPVQPEILGILRAAGAVHPAAAVALEPMTERERRQLECLVREGILVEASPGSYFLIEDAWSRHLARLRRLALVAAGVIVVAVLALLAIVGAWRGPNP